MKGFVVIGIVLTLFFTAGSVVAYDLSRPEMVQFRAPLYSSQDMLEAIWYDYKKNYIEADTGRTLDRQRDDITTSEGQSYTMLRSVWMDDYEMFQLSWRWTKDNLRKSSNVFAWLFGQREDGSYGVLEDRGGRGSASDADVDIALALLLGYGRWGEEKFLEEAREVMRGIWETQVVTINGKPYLLANDVEKQFDKQWYIINPSYYAPYAYRIFKRFDPERDWLGLVDTSYDIIEYSMNAPLDRPTSAGLPPNWLYLNSQTAALTPTDQDHLTTEYGYDAIRTPWRVALDVRWFPTERGKEVLDMFSFLSDEYANRGLLYAEYSHDGNPIVEYESFSMYGTALGYFVMTDPVIARRIHDVKLFPNYNGNQFRWYNDPGYYGDNWGWFGLAFYHNQLYNYVDFLME